MSRSRIRGFTLMELLVVVGIIIIMTALSIPAVKKFMDGQKLSQSGRVLQSSFNEARRAAITQRTKQFLVFYRETDNNGKLRYGMVRYRDRFGYEGDAHRLLPNVEIDKNELTSPPSPLYKATCVGMGVPIFEGIPPQNHTIFQGNKLSPNVNAAGSPGWVEFDRDGTIALTTPLNPNLPTPGSPASAVFDLNTHLDNVPDSTAAAVDMNLRELNNTDVDKRCFIDIDPNTGRLKFRVVQCVAGS